MDTKSLVPERKTSSFMISDILAMDTKSRSLPPPPPTCSVSNNAWQDVSSDDNSPTDSGLGDCKERPDSPSVDADSPPSSQNSKQSMHLFHCRIPRVCIYIYKYNILAKCLSCFVTLTYIYFYIIFRKQFCWKIEKETAQSSILFCASHRA